MRHPGGTQEAPRSTTTTYFNSRLPLVIVFEFQGLASNSTYFSSRLPLARVCGLLGSPFHKHRFQFKVAFGQSFPGFDQKVTPSVPKVSLFS